MTPQARPELRVVKLGYSVDPWRIVDADGQELWRDELFDHPMLGRTVISMPICFPRKREAVAWLAARQDGMAGAAAAGDVGVEGDPAAPAGLPAAAPPSQSDRRAS